MAIGCSKPLGLGNLFSLSGETAQEWNAGQEAGRLAVTGLGARTDEATARQGTEPTGDRVAAPGESKDADQQRDRGGHREHRDEPEGPR